MRSTKRTLSERLQDFLHPAPRRSRSRRPMSGLRFEALEDRRLLAALVSSPDAAAPLSPADTFTFTQTLTHGSVVKNGDAYPAFKASVKIAHAACAGGMDLPLETTADANPITLSFLAGPNPSGAQSKSWDITVSLPAGTADGTYSGRIKADTDPNKAVGQSNGTCVTLTKSTVPPPPNQTTDTAPPQVVFVNLTGPQHISGETTYITSATSIKVNVSDNSGAVSSCTISVPGSVTPSSPCVIGDNAFFISGADGDYTVSASATDAAVNTGSLSPLLGLTLDNTGPSLTLPGDSTTGPDSPAGAIVSYDATADDAGSGVSDAGVSCVAASESNFELGANTVACTAVDNLGNSSAGTFTITVNAVGLNPAGNLGIVLNCNSGGNVVLIDSTVAGAAVATVNGDAYGPYNLSVNRASVFGSECVDVITMTGGVILEAHGGDANDIITGGSGNDVLFGDDGDDSLTGGAGNDVLVGGAGADRLVGSSGHDVLISGSLVGLDYQALRAIGDAWANNKTAGTGDIKDTADGDGAVGDDESNKLTGGSGYDWFIISLEDVITDLGKLKKPGLFDGLMTAEGDLVTII